MPSAQRHPDRRHAKRTVRGFSLTELLVTIGVFAILAALTGPSMARFYYSARANQLSGALMATLRQGRNEAMKRNIGVLVCPSNTAATNCASATDWASNGWLVCYAATSTTTCDAGSAALPNPIMIQGPQSTSFATIVGPATAIRFNSYGAQASSTNVVLTITGTWSKAVPLTITVYPNGQAIGTRMTSMSTHS